MRFEDFCRRVTVSALREAAESLVIRIGEMREIPVRFFDPRAVETLQTTAEDLREQARLFEQSQD